MSNTLSIRLMEIVEALPLYEGIRVLEIGCGPGAAAREISKRIGNGHILAIDRSEKAISQALGSCESEIKSGRLSFRVMKAEELALSQKEEKFDLVFAVRVGAFDGRHPEIEMQALSKVANVLKKSGKFFIDGGTPLKQIDIEKYRKGTVR